MAPARRCTPAPRSSRSSASAASISSSACSSSSWSDASCTTARSRAQAAPARAATRRQRMVELWFAIAAVTVTLYVIADGFDLGAGALHLVVARTDRERRQVLAAIGPFWDGNEVWLLAGGGVLFLAFPKVLASGLSGFYLAIMFVLWGLILRGIAIEFRSHIDDGLWRAFWDGTFAFASTLVPVLLGVALGNVIRGVPLFADGWFVLSLFESFSPRGALGILDWFTLLAGLFSLAAVVHHGALFLVWKTDGAVRERSLHAAA